MVRIRTPDPDYFQNSTGTSLSKNTTAIKIFMKIRSLWKYALSGNVEESFLKSLDLNPEADDFQNSLISSLYIDTSVVKYLREALFSSFYVKLLTDRQTNKQTDRQTDTQTNARRHYITSLADVLILSRLKSLKVLEDTVSLTLAFIS